MKTSVKMIIGFSTVLSFLTGFLIGIMVEYPKTNDKDLAGTIGKLNNYRNVKVTDNDIQLRSDLQTNEALLKSYRQFYTFNYTTCIKLCEDIDFAIKVIDEAVLFSKDNQSEVDHIKQYRETLEQARKDILMAVLTLQQIKETNQNDLIQIINNANVAVALVKYKQNELLSFVEAIEEFMARNNPNEFSDLIKVHDMFAVNQLVIAAMTNDKPMLKAYNNKKLFSSEADLKGCIASQEVFQSSVTSDFNQLQREFKNTEQLYVCDASVLGSVQEMYHEIVPAFENMGLVVGIQALNVNSAGSQSLELVENSERAGILNTERLGATLNSEKLGIFRQNSFSLADFEKLAALNTEILGILPIAP